MKKVRGIGSNKNKARIIEFNKTYGRLLLSLQDIFGNGKTGDFGKAIALMRQLQINFNYCIRPRTMLSANEPATDPANAPKIRYDPVAPDWRPPQDMLFD